LPPIREPVQPARLGDGAFGIWVRFAKPDVSFCYLMVDPAWTIGTLREVMQASDYHIPPDARVNFHSRDMSNDSQTLTACGMSPTQCIVTILGRLRGD
jgi:hypothetical protein